MRRIKIWELKAFCFQGKLRTRAKLAEEVEIRTDVFNVGRLTGYLWADRNERVKTKINAVGENGIIAWVMTLSLEKGLPLTLDRRPKEA